MKFNIAIDGPAGAGKSTIARLVSKKLSYIYVDTGAMYRAMGLYFTKKNIPLNDEQQINEYLDDVKINLVYENGLQQIILNGENVSELIRTREISEASSIVSTYKLVREKMVKLQQEIAKANNVVMDGRDIGTVVLPDASLKIYLTASVESRAKRRYKELIEKDPNQSINVKEIEKEITERDYRDMHRENSPLKCADDAIVIDSSNMTIDEEVNKIIDLCKLKG